MLTELKGKAESFGVVAVDSPVQSVGGEAKANAGGSSNIGDAISALTNLGYNRSDVFTTVTRIANENNEMSLEDLVKEGIKELGLSVKKAF